MLVEVENVLFVNSLIGTTTQDSGKRKRNNVYFSSIIYQVHLFRKYITAVILLS